MDLFLGIPYCRGDQTRFERALNAGELEKAFEILARMPHASENNRADEMRRNTVLAIGYRILAQHFLAQTGKGKLIGQQLSKLSQYEGINPSPDALKAKLQRLEEYEGINHSLNDLTDNMDDLKRYQELGRVWDLKSLAGELEHLQEEIRGLDSVPNI